MREVVRIQREQPRAACDSVASGTPRGGRVRELPRSQGSPAVGRAGLTECGGTGVALPRSSSSRQRRFGDRPAGFDPASDDRAGRGRSGRGGENTPSGPALPKACGRRNPRPRRRPRSSMTCGVCRCSRAGLTSIPLARSRTIQVCQSPGGGGAGRPSIGGRCPALRRRAWAPVEDLCRPGSSGSRGDLGRAHEGRNRSWAVDDLCKQSLVGALELLSALAPHGDISCSVDGANTELASGGIRGAVRR